MICERIFMNICDYGLTQSTEGLPGIPARRGSATRLPHCVVNSEE